MGDSSMGRATARVMCGVAAVRGGGCWWATGGGWFVSVGGSVCVCVCVHVCVCVRVGESAESKDREPADGAGGSMALTLFSRAAMVCCSVPTM
jgi:hypothetical protein